jgi:pimeloyl-ACP methyl ester carboxylesterase
LRKAALLAAIAVAWSCLVPVAASAAEAFFDSAGVKIRYLDEGRGDPVILVHGYSTNTEEQWIQSKVLPELSRSYRVVAFDSRGHGKSDKPHAREQYGPQMAKDIFRLMDHLGIRRAHIVGYSLGAHIVAQGLTLSPHRYATLSMGGGAGRWDWTVQDTNRAETEAAEMDQGLLSSQILRLWPKDKPLPTSEELRALSSQRLAGKDHIALAAVRRSNQDQVLTAESLARTGVPILAMVGTQDTVQKNVVGLKQQVPSVQLVMIEGASHGSAPSSPQFISALKAFLQAHPSAVEAR